MVDLTKFTFSVKGNFAFSHLFSQSRNVNLGPASDAPVRLAGRLLSGLETDLRRTVVRVFLGEYRP